MTYPLEKKQLHQPTLQEVCSIWKEKLKENYQESDVEVVDCPDLTSKDWGLAAKGLCGSPKIGEVGGVPYLLPLYNKDKYYEIDDALKASGIADGLIIGAGAGPFRYLGKNSELILNEQFGKTASKESRAALVGEEGAILQKLPDCENCFGLLLNFFVCEGESGPVLKVTAKKRTGELDLIVCLRQALTDYYGDKSVGFGGAFRVDKGSVKIHVMPDFSKTPLYTAEDVFKWFALYDVPAPLVFMSVALSKDPQMDFRLEHSHGYGTDTGGHYEYDVTPDEMQYTGYFNIAEEIIRIDKPSPNK